ncbi:methyltransferase [Streptomyces sp. NBRC 110611]|uniref:class I SAM-dependent methyltransferase n=1 Tax=Streptomyces sp. NBRC 110611 TaxID=1621259 RepID=UPI00085790C7|nr:hypothetical protein [Streptomyces sp. NBRC 110611]GAU69512.1 methyltransferase [Streptomyces sp. NBRC 110611]
MTATDPTDAVVRAYLARHPDATVIALGEGLENGFWRLDNGRLTWLTVVPPETAALRRMLLPDGARRRTVACATGGHGWLDAVREPWRGVVVTAPGVLTRLPRPAVRALVAACAERFPGGALVFDAPSWWAAGLADAHPGVAAVRTRRPAGPRHRLPVLRALRPVVWEVRFAAERRRTAGTRRGDGAGPAA